MREGRKGSNPRPPQTHGEPSILVEGRKFGVGQSCRTPEIDQHRSQQGHIRGSSGGLGGTQLWAEKRKGSIKGGSRTRGVHADVKGAALPAPERTHKKGDHCNGKWKARREEVLVKRALGNLM